MPSTCINNFLTPVWHRVNYILYLFFWNSIPHCHDGLLKILKLVEGIQVQALLHQPPNILNQVQVRTISWVTVQLNSLALQVLPYYFSCVTACTILHELKSVPPEDGNDVRLEYIFIQNCILSLVYFVYIQLCPPFVPHPSVDHYMEPSKLSYLYQVLEFYAHLLRAANPLTSTNHGSER